MFAPLSVFGSGVVSDDGVTVTPFLYVLAEHEHTLTHYFVAQQQSVHT